MHCLNSVEGFFFCNLLALSFKLFHNPKICLRNVNFENLKSRFKNFFRNHIQLLQESLHRLFAYIFGKVHQKFMMITSVLTHSLFLIANENYTFIQDSSSVSTNLLAFSLPQTEGIEIHLKSVQFLLFATEKQINIPVTS